MWVHMYCTLSNTCTVCPLQIDTESSSVVCTKDRCKQVSIKETPISKVEKPYRAWVPLIPQYPEIIWFSSHGLSGYVGYRWSLLWWYRGSADLSTATIVCGCIDPSLLRDLSFGVNLTPNTLHVVSVRYEERYLKACAQQSLCRWYIAQSFEAQLMSNCDRESIYNVEVMWM